MAAPTLTQVNPIEFVREAADILRAAWQPPSLDYSAEWLRWRLSTPSSLPPLGFTAVSSGVPVAFAAAFGVRVQFSEREQDVYLCSFMASRPGTPGLVAPLLIRAEARHLKQAQTPFLVFAQKDSAGEQLLAVLNGQFAKHLLGTYVGHAAMSATPENHNATVVPAETWIAVRKAIAPAQPVIEMSFDRERLEHELADPWGRQCLVAYAADGLPSAAALVANTRTLAKSGPQVLISLHYARANSSSGLKSLISFALRENPRGVLTIPNCASLSPEILRDSRVRATPSRFGCQAYSINSAESVLTAAAVTDTEII